MFCKKTKYVNCSRLEINLKQSYVTFFFNFFAIFICLISKNLLINIKVLKQKIEFDKKIEINKILKLKN